MMTMDARKDLADDGSHAQHRAAGGSSHDAETPLLLQRVLLATRRSRHHVAVQDMHGKLLPGTFILSYPFRVFSVSSQADGV